MVDFFIVGCIIIILSGALFYLHKERKKGARCVGCPHAGKCNTHEGEKRNSSAHEQSLADCLWEKE